MEVAQFVALRASACVGADYSNMASLDRERQSLRLFHGTFLAPEIADRYTDIPLSAPFPIAAAVRLDEPVLLPDLDSYRREFPMILADTIAAGVQATASIPLHRADGSLVGALGFAWAGPTRFDAKLVSALRAVGELCTATIERAEQYDAEHQFVADVSASLLGDLPALAGLDTAAHYLPAGRTTAVGGDWYEGLLLDNDKVALVVGDVVGHGLAAAADMMIIRGMVTAVLHAGVPVAEVFSELATVLQQRATVLLATAALVVVDMAADTITYTTAGHPPPVIQYPTGQFRRLDEANSAMLGLGSIDRIAATVPFPAGARLVMFTDGLVERRDRTFDLGIDQVAATLATLPDSNTANEIAGTLLDALADGCPAEDDIAIVVAQHLTSPDRAG